MGFLTQTFEPAPRVISYGVPSWGDTAIIKQQKQNKLTPKFNPNPLTVSKVNGSQIVLKGKDGSTFRRNISHMKVVKPHNVNKPVIMHVTDDTVYPQPRRSM